MDTPAPVPARPTRDRWIALGSVALAALLAAGWVTRERQLATDLAESREDLRQAMHRLKTVSASTDQIRNAYLQRRTELEAARKKIDQLAQRQEERKRETPAPKDGKRLEPKAEGPAGAAALFEKISSLKLPSWAAVQKSDDAVRILPGVGLPAGNEGFATFGSIARVLAEADPDMVIELKARAEPGPSALDTAQDRAKRLSASAERSMKKEVSRIRIVAEVGKGPRMEWRLVPTAAAPKVPAAKP